MFHVAYQKQLKSAPWSASESLQTTEALQVHPR